MSRQNGAEAIGHVFEGCARAGRAAFIPFFVAGDPEGESSTKYVSAAAQSGADIVEVGIPYSDPLADGPSIARAATRARENGMTFDRALGVARNAAVKGTPLLAFTYYNPVAVRGVEKTVADLADHHFSGIVVPDLPLDESAELMDACKEHGLAMVLLVAPTTPRERAKAIVSVSTGFIYIVSRMGVTGVSATLDEAVATRISELRSITDKPLAVGFGIGTAADAAAVATHADGVIVGSALVDAISAAANHDRAVDEVKRMCLAFAAACQRSETGTRTRALA